VGFSPCGVAGAPWLAVLRDVGNHYQSRRLGDNALKNRICQRRFYDFIFGPTASASRSYDTCIAIQRSGDW
jgi:hypothetical protein